MQNRRPIHRPERDQATRQADESREATKRSFEILQQPTPDTFLGRKTQEPFPKEDDEGPRG
jgi:hypothetical protein